MLFKEVYNFIVNKNNNYQNNEKEDKYMLKDLISEIDSALYKNKNNDNNNNDIHMDHIEIKHESELSLKEELELGPELNEKKNFEQDLNIKRKLEYELESKKDDLEEREESFIFEINEINDIDTKKKKKFDSFISKQQELIKQEKLNMHKKWMNKMENEKSICKTDSIISLKLLVQEAFRRNPILKEKYNKKCQEIFSNNCDPIIIKQLLLKLSLFSDSYHNELDDNNLDNEIVNIS